MWAEWKNEQGWKSPERYGEYIGNILNRLVSKDVCQIIIELSIPDFRRDYVLPTFIKNYDDEMLQVHKSIELIKTDYTIVNGRFSYGINISDIKGCIAKMTTYPSSIQHIYQLGKDKGDIITYLNKSGVMLDGFIFEKSADLDKLMSFADCRCFTYHFLNSMNMMLFDGKIILVLDYS